MFNAKDLIPEAEIQNIILPYALKYLRDMSSFSLSAIAAFYGDYNPKMYKRKFGLVNMWQGEASPIPMGYSATMEYSSDYFGASHNSDEAVFNGPFMQGYHGGPEAWGHIRNVPKMSPSPWELIETFSNTWTI